MIPQRPVGKTGINLSRIGFGGAPLGDLRRVPEAAEAERILETAWAEGIRYYDTAPFYGMGLSERRTGDFLREKPRDDYVLSTKVGRLMVPDRAAAQARLGGDVRAMPFRAQFDFTYDGIMRSHEHSLQRLGLDRVDILYLHDLGRFAQRDTEAQSWQQLMDGGLRAMLELRDGGAVRAIGAGVNEWQVLDKLMDHARWDVFLLANRYTLLDQVSAEHFLPRCLREGVAIVDGAPLNSGILATGAIPGAIYDYQPAPEEVLAKVRTIDAICAKHEVPRIGAAMVFPLAHPAITAIIPGFARLSDLQENLRAFRATYPPALWADLKAAGIISPAAPVPTAAAL